jgi:hypothetical protein
VRRTVLSMGWVAAVVLGSAQAKECKGVDFPEHLQVSGHDLTLNGLGMRKATFLKINVYVGALYVTHASHDAPPLIDPGTPAQLILHFVRNGSAGQMRDAWNEAFEKVAQGQSTFAPKIATLDGWMTDLKTGQRLVFTRVPGAGIEVSVNGAVKGTIAGDDFARALMSIWLGDSPPNPELKSGLLGGECD